MHKDEAEPVVKTPGDGWLDRNQMRLLKGGMITVFLMLLLGGFYISYEIRGATQRADASARAVKSLSKNLDSSRKQLTDHGITPSAPPAKTVIQQVGGIPGAAGAPGRNGTSGIPGPSGPPGPSGSPGSAGHDGSSGEPGKNGQDGVPGADGAAGPTGPPGIPGAAGADGTNGVDGKNGQDGKDGAPGPQGEKGDPGPTGPAGTLPPTITFNRDTGTETCTLDSGSDSSYTCTTQPPGAGGTPSPTTASLRSATAPQQQGFPLVLSGMYAIVSDRKRL